jgi:hypothetical protein
MTDLVDAADLQIEQALAYSIARTFDTGPKYSPKGYCHHCDDPVGDQQIFCNSECAEAEQRLAARAAALRGRKWKS